MKVLYVVPFTVNGIYLRNEIQFWIKVSKMALRGSYLTSYFSKKFSNKIDSNNDYAIIID